VSGDDGRLARDPWAAEQEALLRGLAHALSNRVGTIVSAVGMLLPGAPAAAPIVEMLHDEGVRLEELLGLVRLLGGDGGDCAPEPIHLPDLVRPVVALHAQHPDVRDVEASIDETPIDVPAMASPTAVGRVLLLLLTAAKRAHDAGVRVGWKAREGGVAITIDGAPGDDAMAARAAPMLADGARVRATDTGYRIELPRFG
jgi:signal transduction histidine kinase